MGRRLRALRPAGDRPAVDGGDRHRCHPRSATASAPSAAASARGHSPVWCGPHPIERGPDPVWCASLSVWCGCHSRPKRKSWESIPANHTRRESDHTKQKIGHTKRKAGHTKRKAGHTKQETNHTKQSVRHAPCVKARNSDEKHCAHGEGRALAPPFAARTAKPRPHLPIKPVRPRNPFWSPASMRRLFTACDLRCWIFAKIRLNPRGTLVGRSLLPCSVSRNRTHGLPRANRRERRPA